MADALVGKEQTADAINVTDGQEKPLVDEPEREEIIDLFYPNDADFATIDGKRNILEPGRHYND